MWFNKKEVKKETDPFADKVKCEDCKHWVDEEECQKVKVRTEPYIGLYTADSGIRTKYYCPMHKKSYDIEQKWPELKYLKIIPEHEEEVDKNGKPIAPKKKKS